MFRLFKQRRRRALGFESLECRQLMAGDIHAFMVNGDVVFQGDSEANILEVRGNGNPGELLVIPTDTTIDGNAGEMVITGVTGGFTFSGGQGNDQLTVKDFAFNGDAAIFGDAGADIIKIGDSLTGNISFTGRLVVTEQAEGINSSDNDYVSLGRLTVGTRILVETWGGNDTINLYDVRANGSTDGFPTLHIRGQTGSDVVNIAYATVYGDMKILMDSNEVGNDLISMITSVVYGPAYLDVWNGVNTVALNANQFLSTTEIWSEVGNDTITLTNTFFNKRLNISGGAENNGDDRITLTNNTISERVYIYAGGGNDTIDIRSNQIVTAGIFSAGGYDGVIVRNNIFYGQADFVGGSEYDVLFMSGNLFLAPYGYYQFESVQP
jgi:hypothetical protein